MATMNVIKLVKYFEQINDSRKLFEKDVTG